MTTPSQTPTPNPTLSSSTPAPTENQGTLPVVEQDPLLLLSELRFQQILQPSQEVASKMADLCVKHDLVGFAEAGPDTPDAARLAVLRQTRNEKLAELDGKIAIAKEKFGQVEVIEAQLARASYAAKTGSKEEAAKFFIADDFDFKSVSTGKHIDLLLDRARLAFAWDDSPQIKAHLNEAARLLELGGDWDRRNRLKVYQGVYAVLSRNFSKAASEFLSGLATFTAEELFSYERFVLYTILASLVALERVELKKKLVDSPEVIGVVDPSVSGVSKTHPHDQFNARIAGRLMNALYECRYRDFFVALVDVHSVLVTDRYFARHARWFIREMRVRAYSQYLASYRSVKLASMAETFGVSAIFMEAELATFIASKRIPAKIDALVGVVETNRPDMLNQEYGAVIKQGDALLNRIQKLARAINV